MTADLSLNMSLYQHFSSIDFNARRPPQEKIGSEVKENVRRVHFC